jgi:hypothetical protein
MNFKKRNIGYIPYLTFILGFSTFVLISIKNKVFWFSSAYDIPLISNVSVMLGDSLLLPIANYMIFNLLFNKSINIKTNRKSLIFWCILILIFSIYLNIYTHITWKNDNYTDFISYEKGKLEFVGYWHCIFSIIEVSIFAYLPILWYYAIKQRNFGAVKYANKTWMVVFLFSTLSIFDMIGKFIFIYKDKQLNLSTIEITPFSSSLVSLVVLVLLKTIEKINLKKQTSSTVNIYR